MNNQSDKKLIFLGLIAKKIVKPLHGFTVSGRRIIQLRNNLIKLLPEATVLEGLDVGCGSGELAKKIQDICPDIRMSGVEVLVRENTAINVTKFDGKRLPFEDKSYDFTMLVDVLHHTDDPAVLIRECVRVSRQFILIKDHLCESWWDRVRLRFMDWVGNRGYDVYLPYNYLSQKNWDKLYQIGGVVCEAKVTKLNLYSYPFSLLFDSHLHFIAKLVIP